MDLAIAIGIWIAGFGMSLVGIEMTIHPPNDKTNAKYWYRGIFIVLGVLFLGFNICQFVRGQADAKHRDQQHEKEELRHEGETKFTQGQLDAIAKVMERLSSSDAGNKPVAVRELAAAISSIVQHDNRPQSIPPASAPYSDWPTAKLRDEVKKLAYELRGIEDVYNSRIMGLEMGFYRGQQQGLSQEEKQEVEKRFAEAKVTEAERPYQDAIKTTYPKAINLQDELLHRLTMQKPPQGSPKTVADYLEKLASLL